MSKEHPPDFRAICESHGGVQTKSGYEFGSVTAALKVASGRIEAPAAIADRVCTVERKFNQLVFQVRGDDDCAWSRTVRVGYLTLIVPIEPEPIECVRVVGIKCDGIARQEGIYVQERDGNWCLKNETSAIRVLMFMLGIRKSEAEVIMGWLHRHPWWRICIPFLREYPSDREWNRGAAQLAFEAVEGEHPHWDAIFNHVGHALTPYIPAGLTGIRDGGDYLRAWLACILRDPACRLPYLFLYGEENCGKSMFWEAFALLVTCGVVKADRALTSEFNGELDGAILCAVEERDISGASGVLERMKDAITGQVLAIRRLFSDQYQVPNYTHWVQTSNSRGACLIPPGDTRFVAIPVGKLTQDIPKPELIDRLKAEGPAIVHTLLTMQLPESQGRLALPAIDTPDKLAIQAQHLPLLAHKIVDFMAERKEWSGTASQLRDEIGEGPKSIARLHAVVSGFAPYLALQGIAAEFPEQRTNKGLTIKLRKSA
jgi:hypothetical protein